MSLFTNYLKRKCSEVQDLGVTQRIEVEVLHEQKEEEIFLTVTLDLARSYDEKGLHYEYHIVDVKPTDNTNWDGEFSEHDEREALDSALYGSKWFKKKQNHPFLQ
jgi:hypothetical protein